MYLQYDKKKRTNNETHMRKGCVKFKSKESDKRRFYEKFLKQKFNQLTMMKKDSGKLGTAFCFHQYSLFFVA